MTQDCRRASVPSCEAFTDFTSGDRPFLNTSVLAIKLGDTVDVGILWGSWLVANNSRLKSSAWAAAGSPVASPQAPTLTSPVLDRSTGETAVLVNASAAAIGDVYYLENTVIIEPDPALTALALADRTLVRRIQVKVAAG